MTTIPLPTVHLESHTLIISKLSEKSKPNLLLQKFGKLNFLKLKKHLDYALATHFEVSEEIKWDSILLSYNGSYEYTGICFFPDSGNVFQVREEVLNPLSFGLILTITAINHTLRESLDSDFRRFLEANLYMIKVYISPREDGDFLLNVAC